MTLTIYQHPKKDECGRFVFDCSEAANLSGGESVQCRAANYEKAIESIKQHLYSWRGTFNITLEVKVKSFVLR